MNEHTPTPWELKDALIVVRGRGVIARCPSPTTDGVYEFCANRRFIVRACNSHDALLAACKEAVRRIRGTTIYDDVEKMLDAAIAAAEGEQK